MTCVERVSGQAPDGAPEEAAAAPSAVPPARRYVEHVLGAPVTLALRGRHADDAVGRAAWADVVASLREVDEVFSTTRPESFVSRLGRGEIALADCPPEVGEVLDLAEVARVESNGAFDVRLPDAEGRVVIDPSGIVKGWAVERAAVRLLELAETDHCLSAGGDLTAHTASPDGAPWRVGVEDPRDPSRLVAVLPVRRGAVATTALTHRGPHVVDPRTGEMPTALTSVTVVGSRLTWVDVEATAALVLGEDAPAWLAGRPGRTGVLVWADGRVEHVGPTPRP